MATRVSRKSTTTTTSQASTSGMETPSKSGTSPGRRGRSPSPARITRIQEKEQLQNLNDRLASYIDRVKYLENENNRLQYQVRSTEETVTREVTNVKSLYESELDEARKLLDDISKEKARLQLEAGKYKTEAEEWKSKYLRRDRDAKNAEKRVLDLQSQLSELQAKLDDAEANRKHAEAEAANLRADLARAERSLADVQKQLEEETLLRVDRENRLQSIKEELAFKHQLHEQELNETRTRTTMHMEEVDSGIRDEYDSKLLEALQQMREEQEDQLRSVREDVEVIYERKVTDLQGALDRSMTVGSSSREDYLLQKRKVDEMASEVTKLKAQNAAYEARIRDLEAQLRSEQDLYEQRLSQKEVEIHELRNSLDEQTQEYIDLLDVKLKLDNEIAAYRKLLEGEEERLNLSASFEGSPRKSRGTKRKRATLAGEELSKSSSEFASSSESKGAVEIHDTDYDGKFIKLFNTGEEDIPIGGWILRHSAGDADTTFKFHRSLILKAGQFVTVWSSDQEQTHCPPSDLVMKNQKWGKAEEMRTCLTHGDEEVASRELKKVRVSTTTTRFRRLGDGDEVDGREKCSIM